MSHVCWVVTQDHYSICVLRMIIRCRPRTYFGSKRWQLRCQLPLRGLQQWWILARESGGSFPKCTCLSNNQDRENIGIWHTKFTRAVPQLEALPGKFRFSTHHILHFYLFNGKTSFFQNPASAPAQQHEWIATTSPTNSIHWYHWLSKCYVGCASGFIKFSYKHHQ